MKNEKRVENTSVFETISNTDANFLNLHIDKARKTQLYLITHFTKQTLNLNYFFIYLYAVKIFIKYTNSEECLKILKAN